MTDTAQGTEEGINLTLTEILLILMRNQNDILRTVATHMPTANAISELKQVQDYLMLNTVMGEECKYPQLSALLAAPPIIISGEQAGDHSAEKIRGLIGEAAKQSDAKSPEYKDHAQIEHTKRLRAAWQEVMDAWHNGFSPDKENPLGKPMQSPELRLALRYLADTFYTSGGG